MFDIPDHFPITINADGDGPECDPTKITKIVCWCGKDTCGRHAEFLLPASDEIAAQHTITTGMQVSMGRTCVCGFWESRNVRYESGSDGLDLHRAEVAEISRLLSALNA